MHPADAVFLRNGGELGFGFEWQLDDLVFRRPALQILAIVADRRQNLARVYRATAMVAPECLTHQHAKIAPLGQV